jgi:hypothetical protein
MKKTKEQRKLMSEGIDYLERLHGIDIDTSKLGDEVVYNMVCLGVEAVFTAVLLSYDCIIDHSGILRLIREIENQQNKPMPQDWIETSRLMSSFQSYCSLEVVKIKIPTKDELKQMFVFGDNVQKYAKQLSAA